MIRVGVISDTHGLLRPEAIGFLAGAQYIIHGGDIGGSRIVEDLSRIAPLVAVRGNNDGAGWAAAIPPSALLQVGDFLIYVIHDLAQLDIDPVAVGVRVVISGHSHKPKVDERGGVLYVNPGSAGPRRFKLPTSLAELHISGKSVRARVMELDTNAVMHPR